MFVQGTTMRAVDDSQLTRAGEPMQTRLENLGEVSRVEVAS